MLSKPFKAKPLLVIGHRGSPRRAPENTLLSFQLAIQEGAHGVEFDVRLSKDLEPVIFHDDTLKRMVGKKGYLKNFSYYDLKNFQVLGKKGMRTDQVIPGLREILETFSKESLFYIELKSENVFDQRARELVHRTTDLVDKLGLVDRCIFVSFDYILMKWIKEHDAKYQTGLNFDTLRQLAHPRKDRFRYLDCLCPRFACLSSRLMEEAKTYRLDLITWVVNDVKSLKKAEKLGVLGIATDDPQRIARHLMI